MDGYPGLARSRDCVGQCPQGEAQERRVIGILVAVLATVRTKETAMIFFSRTASIAPGKASDAIAFGHLIAKYIKETYGTTLEVLVPIGGDPNRIAWHARYDSVADWDAMTTKLLTDKLYVELVSKQNNTFLPGSVHDALWRSL
jgi:hypothetical protein